MRYSSPVYDISTFKRWLHCIMRAEHGARDFQRRDEARRTHIAIIRRFWWKLNVIYPVKDNSTFKCSFHCIMRAERRSRDFQRRDETRHKQIAIILRFFSKLCVTSLPLEIFTSFIRSFFFTLHAERSVRVFQRREKNRHTHIAIIRRFCR